MKKFWKDLQTVSVSEWLLCMIVASMASLIAVMSYGDEEHPHMSPIFAGQAFWYWIRSAAPVCGWLNEKLQEKKEEEQLAEAE